MARQIEPEMSAWYLRRKALRAELLGALDSTDFSAVETAQYSAVATGPAPFPESLVMETKLLEQMRQGETRTFKADDGIGITLQVNTLESFRRAYLSQKQTKRDLLRHLAQKVEHGDRYDDLMLQQFTGTDKILSPQ